MVKCGLKVGQTFEDGGFTYKVKKVNQDGSYESKRVVPTADNSEEKSGEVGETDPEKDSKPTKKSSSRKSKNTQ